MSEVLTSAKGTTFYVLTVAGEHGVPPPSPKSQKDEAPEKAGETFVTEAPPKEEAEEELPDYIKVANVSNSLLNDVKKQ